MDKLQEKIKEIFEKQFYPYELDRMYEFSMDDWLKILESVKKEE